MAVTHPLFASEKDDQSMQLIENPSHICSLEAADLLNGECIFWNANGNGVSVVAAETFFMLETGDAVPCAAPLSLRDAFSSYARSLGLPDIDVDGPPGEVWRRIRKEIDEAELPLRIATWN